MLAAGEFAEGRRIAVGAIDAVVLAGIERRVVARSIAGCRPPIHDGAH
jgi:hypothetical protein